MPWIIQLSKGNKIQLENEEDATRFRNLLVDLKAPDYIEVGNQTIKKAFIVGVVHEDQSVSQRQESDKFT